MLCSPLLTEPRTLIPGPVRAWIGRRLSGPPRGPRRRQRRACLFAFGRIGDFVLALSTLRLFVQHFGADQCTLVVLPGVTPLAAAELPGVELITLPVYAGSLTREILPIWWREKPQFSRDRFACRIAVSHQRFFYGDLVLSWIDAEKDFRLLPSTYPHPSPDEQCTELHAHRRLAAAVLGRAVAWEEILPRFTGFTARNEGRLMIYPLSHDGSRNIPVERVAAIVRLWRAHSQAPIVLGGSQPDHVTLQGYAALACEDGRDKPVVETPAGVKNLITHLAGAGAVLAADSAAGHIAAAFDKPTVVLTPRQWHGLCQPWHQSERQKVFLLGETQDETIAAALPALAPATAGDK